MSLLSKRKKIIIFISFFEGKRKQNLYLNECKCEIFYVVGEKTRNGEVGWLLVPVLPKFLHALLKFLK